MQGENRSPSLLHKHRYNEPDSIHFSKKQQRFLHFSKKLWIAFPFRKILPETTTNMSKGGDKKWEKADEKANKKPK